MSIFASSYMSSLIWVAIIIVTTHVFYERIASHVKISAFLVQAEALTSVKHCSPRSQTRDKLWSMAPSELLLHGTDNSCSVSTPGVWALWTLWICRPRLTDLQADSSQTCQSRDPGSVWTGPGPAGPAKVCISKAIKLYIWQWEANAILPPTLFTYLYEHPQ